MNQVEMQYLGACALLGRLSSQIKDPLDRDAIRRCLDDAARAFPGRFEVVKTHNGGMLLEPIMPVCDGAPR